MLVSQRRKWRHKWRHFLPSGEGSGGCSRQQRIPHRPVVHRHTCVQTGKPAFPSGSLQEGSGRWSLPRLGDPAKPATTTQPCPRRPAPGLSQLISLPHRTQQRGLLSQPMTVAPERSNLCIPCRVPPPTGMSLPQSSLDPAHCVRPPVSH